MHNIAGCNSQYAAALKKNLTCIKAGYPADVGLYERNQQSIICLSVPYNSNPQDERFLEDA